MKSEKLSGTSTKLFISIAITMATLPGRTSGHGYMVEPPSRQSAARLGYSFIPWNYNDNALYCGGMSHQWDVNEGRCGVCGDPWDESPRSYEYPDGRYVKGIPPVNKVYAMGQTIEVIVHQTAGHRGYHSFRLCNRDNLEAPDATEECLEQNVLRFENGATRMKEADFCNGIYMFRVKLPQGLTCQRCFFQWKYHAGQNWGCFRNGVCCLGCGERQEEFYACADIVIRDDVPVTSPLPGYTATCSLSSTVTPNRPTPTPRPTSTTASTSTQSTTTTTTPTTPSTTPTTTTTADSELRRLCRSQDSLCGKMCSLGLFWCHYFPQCRDCIKYLGYYVKYSP